VKRPWHVWFLFGLGLLVVVPAFVWLTVKALELDRAELLARSQAEFEEDVSRALWRMDSLLFQLVGDEAARPDFVYRPVVEFDAPATEEKGKGQPSAARQELSPLLAQPPQYVLVHFEVHPDGCVTSPQNPTGELNKWAIANGASLDTINTAATRLAQLMPVLRRDELLAQLPEQPLPALSWLDAGPANSQPRPPPPQVIAGNYDDAQQQSFRQQAFQQAAIQQPATQQELAPTGVDNSYQINAPPQAAAVGPPATNPASQSDDENAQLREAGSRPSQQQADFAYGAQVGSNAAEGSRSQRSQSRGGSDLPNRTAALQSYAQRAFNEQRSNLRVPPPSTRVVEGVSRTFWLDDRLLLARRVKIGDKTLVQGCWLDWDALQVRLRQAVADLLPAVEFRPLTAVDLNRPGPRLASIPVQLAVSLPQVESAPWSPIRVSLLVAWACLALAAMAAAVTLQRTIALSERRGAFVAAVTHELRTPLTTFRMYAEMLAVGMVPDPQQRQKYLQTLRVEADRLAHLVENVLQYARLERGRPGKRRAPTTLGAVLDHCRSRLADRASQGELKLVVEHDESVLPTTLFTDVAAVEQILFNLVDNACKYAACSSDKRLHLTVRIEPKRVTVAVRDHGPGIAPAGRKRLFQPFSKSVHEAAHSAPGVGLGLALCRRLAHDLGGKLELHSPADGGAEFVLTLPR
jgi:signal transduction histidine kinase